MKDHVQHCTCGQAGGGGDGASFTNLDQQCYSITQKCGRRQSRRSAACIAPVALLKSINYEEVVLHGSCGPLPRVQTRPRPLVSAMQAALHRVPRTPPPL